MVRAHGVAGALLALLGGCRVWDSPSVDLAMVPLPSAAPCAELVGEARARGLAVLLEVFTHVIAWDETLLLHGDVERIDGRTGLSVGKRPIREYRARLTCGPTYEPLALPVRTCRIRGRAYGVVDLRALEDLAHGGDPEDPCRLHLDLRVGRTWKADGHAAIVRRSPRALLEGSR